MTTIHVGCLGEKAVEEPRPGANHTEIARLTTALAMADELVTALDICLGSRGKFSCTQVHDCRCPKDRGIGGSCICGADELESVVQRYRAALEKGK